MYEISRVLSKFSKRFNIFLFRSHVAQTKQHLRHPIPKKKKKKNTYTHGRAHIYTHQCLVFLTSSICVGVEHSRQHPRHPSPTNKTKTFSPSILLRSKGEKREEKKIYLHRSRTCICSTYIYIYTRRQCIIHDLLCLLNRRVSDR